MTTVYMQHVFTSISIGATGHTHNRMVDPADPDSQLPTAIDCAACEPYLVKEGWVYAPELVPLTDRQTREQDRVEREGNMAVKQVAEALATTAAAALATGAAAAKRRTSTKKSTVAAG